jgi:hypothetical protein
VLGTIRNGWHGFNPRFASFLARPLPETREYRGPIA